METDTLKWIFIFVIFFITIGAGLAPMKIKNISQNAKWLGIANCFSGGVFLAIAFVHILPETANMYYSAKLKEILSNYQDEGHGGGLGPTTAYRKFMTSDEADMIIEEYSAQFPLPFVLVVAGYAFILLIDKVVIDSHSHAIDDTSCSLEHVQIQGSGKKPKEEGSAPAPLLIGGSYNNVEADVLSDTVKESEEYSHGIEFEIN